MASVERLCSITYFTSEFNFEKGFANFHVCWHVDRLAAGVRSETFQTRVSDGDESVRHRWILEIVNDRDDHNGLSVRLKSIRPPLPTPALIRFALFHDESNQPIFARVDYTVFSTYALDYAFSLPASRIHRQSTLRKRKANCLGESHSLETELHCWLTLPIDLVAKRVYYSKVVSYSFGREIVAYQRPTAPQNAAAKVETPTARESLNIRVIVADEDNDERQGRTTEISIVDPFLLEAVFERPVDDRNLHRFLRPFMNRSDRGSRRKGTRGGGGGRDAKAEEESWPIKPWYEAVMIACFTSDQNRRRQWSAINRHRCTKLAQLKSICLIQLGAVTEPCCAADVGTGVELEPPSAIPKPSPYSRKRKRRHHLDDEEKRKKVPIELQAELWKRKNFVRPLETINVETKSCPCACPCAIL